MPGKKNASPASLRAGWHDYLAHDGQVSLDELNRRLSAAGLDEVSERALKHYSRLRSAGYTRYISMNRLDVALSADRATQFSAGARYEFVAANAPVRMLLGRDRSIVSAVGKIAMIGEAGGVARFSEAEEETLRRDRPHDGDMIRLELATTSRGLDARVIGVELGPGFLDIEFEFGRLQSIVDLVDTTVESSRSEITIQLTTAPESPESLDVIGRQLFYLFELIEAARAVANERPGTSTSARYVPVPEVRSLVRQSPLELAIWASPLLLPILGAAAKALDPLKQWEEWRSRRLDVERKKVELSVREAQAQVDIARAGLQLGLLEIAQARVDEVSEAQKGQLDRSVSSIVTPLVGLLDQGVTALLVREIDLRDNESVDLRRPVQELDAPSLIE